MKVAMYRLTPDTPRALLDPAPDVSWARFGDELLLVSDETRGEGLAETRESKNTQSPRLRFRALLTEGGDPRVQLHRACSSSMVNSPKFV